MELAVYMSIKQKEKYITWRDHMMKVGVLKDIKVGEYRVIATPAEVSMLVGDGNEVYVQ